MEILFKKKTKKKLRSNEWKKRSLSNQLLPWLLKRCKPKNLETLVELVKQMQSTKATQKQEKQHFAFLAVRRLIRRDDADQPQRRSKWHSIDKVNKTKTGQR